MSGITSMKKFCKVLGTLYPCAKDLCGEASNTYQKESGDTKGKPLSLQMPDKGLRRVEQEHNGLVVNVHRGDGIQVQSNLGSKRKRGLLVLTLH